MSGGNSSSGGGGGGATIKYVDAIPGRLVWAKLGQWPYWPSRVVLLDEVPSNLRSGLDSILPSHHHHSVLTHCVLVWVSVEEGFP